MSHEYSGNLPEINDDNDHIDYSVGAMHDKIRGQIAETAFALYEMQTVFQDELNAAGTVGRAAEALAEQGETAPLSVARIVPFEKHDDTPEGERITTVGLAIYEPGDNGQETKRLVNVAETYADMRVPSQGFTEVDAELVASQIARIDTAGLHYVGRDKTGADYGTSDLLRDGF